MASFELQIEERSGGAVTAGISRSLITSLTTCARFWQYDTPSLRWDDFYRYLRTSGGFPRAAARAHSTLRCTASPHGPLRVAYPNFGSPWASCSHLVLSHSSQFASILFVHLPPRFRLILQITQRVPTSFQHKSAR